jgi:hypothetical protein
MTEEKHAETDMRKKGRTLVIHNLNKEDSKVGSIDYVYTAPRSLTDEFAYRMADIFQPSAAAATQIHHKSPHGR